MLLEPRVYIGDFSPPSAPVFCAVVGDVVYDEELYSRLAARALPTVGCDRCSFFLRIDEFSPVINSSPVCRFPSRNVSYYVLLLLGVPFFR